MTSLEHLLVALLLGGVFTVGAAASNLVDLDHRCVAGASWTQYVRAMLNGTFRETQEAQRVLDRGVLHTLWYLAFTLAMAAFWTGYAMNTVLHMMGDGL